MYDGQEVGPIFPKRGIQQGNPLSPYLFILCAEGLSALLHDMENKKMIQGCKVARGTSSISHLLFFDDSYLFFKASLLQCNYIKNYLQVYEKALGQRVNFDKSSAMFSPNVDVDLKYEMCIVFGVYWIHKSTIFI